MGLTRVDWRVLKIAMIFLILVETAALRVLETIPFDVEPIRRPTAFENWRGLVVVILHYPAIFHGDTPWVRSLLFLNGYANMLALLVVVLILHRAAKDFISTL